MEKPVWMLPNKKIEELQYATAGFFYNYTMQIIHSEVVSNKPGIVEMKEK